MLDYGGWPEKVEEVPLKILRGEHWRLILERCTGDAAVSKRKMNSF